MDKMFSPDNRPTEEELNVAKTKLAKELELLTK